MAEATFSLAVENLGDLLIQKADILRAYGVEGENFEEQLMGLKDELQRMKPFLRNAVERQANDETIRDCIFQLREVAQDAEDVIGTFILKVETSVSLPIHVDHLNRVGEQILSIRKRLQEMINFQLLGEGMLLSRRSEAVQSQPTTTPWQDDENVVGLDQDVESLLREAILDERRRGLSAACIVGIGGIGKSTLARKLFNHVSVAERFGLRAWVMISSEYSPRERIIRLVEQLLRPEEDVLNMLETMERLQLGSLQRLLLRRLSCGRYFIVLDDVWERAQWEDLTGAFPDQGNASRLLITSRNRDVTRQAHYVHDMKSLSPSESWQLFLKTVFLRSADNDCPEHLENVGRAILRKCHGLPSAIKEAGSLLVERRSEREWEDVLRRMDFSVTSEAFESSYYQLTPQLKLCFLCLGFFKEGATISAEKLYQVWIAGGMVPQGGQMNEIMEETGRSFLNMLIDQHMVQVEDETKDRLVKHCQIYKLFHKPSIKKAEDEISLEVLREEGDNRSIKKPRHRAIYCSRERFVNSSHQNNYLRSLFFHGGGNFDGTLSYSTSFELLRVLDFEGFGLQQFPEAIITLTGLRYLGLRNNYIRELPDTLGQLHNLKVLDIAHNFPVVLPNVIRFMHSLRHLYMSDIICSTPLEIYTLQNLQTLTYIPVNNWTYERSSLHVMTSLRKLGIEELDEQSDVSNLFTSLAHLENLVCLNLRGFRFKRMPSLNEVGILRRLTQLRVDGQLTTLPSADAFPPILSYLTLVNTSLDDDPMSVLERLPRLLYLKLRNAYSGERMVISHDGFLSLQVLRIRDLEHLRNVDVEIGAMPRLERLEIYSCPRLEDLPEEVRSRTNVDIQ